MGKNGQKDVYQVVGALKFTNIYRESILAAILLYTKYKPKETLMKKLNAFLKVVKRLFKKEDRNSGYENILFV